MEAMLWSHGARGSIVTHGVSPAGATVRNVCALSSPEFCRPAAQKRCEKSEARCVKPLAGFAKPVKYVLTRKSAVLVFLSQFSGLVNGQSALASSYDDLVGNVEDAVSSNVGALQFDLPEVDTSGLVDFLSANPLTVLGAAAGLALPFIVSKVLGQSNYGTVSPKEAYLKLGDKEEVSQLLDIRVGDDVKSGGKADLKSYRKKVTQLPYSSEPAEYLGKVLAKFKDAENTTIYVLDRFDGNSAAVAKLLATGGFKAAYAIKDGFEGPRGWQNSELPWRAPDKGFSLNLESFKELLATSDTGSLVPTTVGVAAAAGVGLVVFSEAETALQLLGSAALVQVFVKKLLFAKDRKKTLEELQSFLDTKVAPKDLVDELKGIFGVLLPKFEEVQTESVNGSAMVSNTVETEPPVVSETVVDTVLEAEPPALSEAVVDTVSHAESAVEQLKVEVEADDQPAIEEPVGETTPATRPLSPYAQYPNLKPPTSPAPPRP